MPQSDQVVDGPGHSVLVRRAHHVDGRIVDVPADDHQRHPPGQQGPGGRWSEHDEGVEPEVVQRLGRLPLPPPLGQWRHDQTESALLGRGVQPFEQVELEDADLDAEHDADQPGLLAGEGASAYVRAVAQLLGGGEDTFPGRRTGARCLAHHDRHQGPRDLGVPRDVLQGDALGRPPPLVVGLGHAVIVPITRSAASDRLVPR